MVRALGFNFRTKRQFVVGSLLYSALRGCSPGTPVFPSLQKLTFPNSSSILECTDISERVLYSLVSVGKQITLLYFVDGPELIAEKRSTETVQIEGTV